MEVQSCPPQGQGPWSAQTVWERTEETVISRLKILALTPWDPEIYPIMLTNVVHAFFMRRWETSALPPP